MTEISEIKKCPYCAEEIKIEAVKCKHCGSMLDGSSSPQVASKREPTSAQVMLEYEGHKKSGIIAALLNLVLPGLGYLYCERYVLGLFVFIIFIALPLYYFGLAGFLASGFLIGLFWLIFIIDGFLCAGRYNKKLALKIATGTASAVPPPVHVPLPIQESANGTTNTELGQPESAVPVKIQKKLPLSKVSKTILIASLLVFVALPLASIVAFYIVTTLPVYQDYIARSQTSEAIQVAEDAEAGLAEYYQANQKWPDNLSDVYATAGQIAPVGQYVDTVVGFGSHKFYAILVTMKDSNVQENISGKALTIWTTDGGNTWKCGAGWRPDPLEPIDFKFLPTTCQEVLNRNSIR